MYLRFCSFLKTRKFYLSLQKFQSEPLFVLDVLSFFQSLFFSLFLFFWQKATTMKYVSFKFVFSVFSCYFELL